MNFFELNKPYLSTISISISGLSRRNDYFGAIAINLVEQPIISKKHRADHLSNAKENLEKLPRADSMIVKFAQVSCASLRDVNKTLNIQR